MAQPPGWVHGLPVTIASLPSATWLADCSACPLLAAGGEKAKGKGQETPLQMEGSWGGEQASSLAAFGSSRQGQGLLTGVACHVEKRP